MYRAEIRELRRLSRSGVQVDSQPPTPLLVPSCVNYQRNVTVHVQTEHCCPDCIPINLRGILFQ